MKKIILFAILISFQTGLSAQNGHFANVNGIKLYYEIYGEGKPLVLLHYFTGSHTAWDPWVDSLSNDYQLIIPDLRGHGNSTNPTHIFRHEDSAKDIYALMDELKIEKFKAMGMSSGGMTLIHMATLDSTKISSMIIIGATTFFPEQARKIMTAVQYETEDKEWIDYLHTIHPGGETQIRDLQKQFREMAQTYDDMNFSTPYLAQIKCPTLIIHGDRDRFFPINIPTDAYKAIPNSYLWIVPNGGHLPNTNELWSDQFLKVSKLFLSGEL